jgi:hypothetical protein
MNINLSRSGNGQNRLSIDSTPFAAEILLGRRPTPGRVADDLADLRLSSPGGQSDHLTPARAINPRFQSPSSDNLGVGNSPGSARQRRSLSHHDPSPHNVADEEPPPQRFHDVDFQQGLANAEGLMKTLAQVLASSPLHTDSESRISELYLQVLDLSVRKNPAARTVGLVGDSGVGKCCSKSTHSFAWYMLNVSQGKSSLLNSLLDVEGFARTVSRPYLFPFSSSSLIHISSNRAMAEGHVLALPPSITTMMRTSLPLRWSTSAEMSCESSFPTFSNRIDNITFVICKMITCR